MLPKDKCNSGNQIELFSRQHTELLMCAKHRQHSSHIVRHFINRETMFGNHSALDWRHRLLCGKCCDKCWLDFTETSLTLWSATPPRQLPLSNAIMVWLQPRKASHLHKLWCNDESTACHKKQRTKQDFILQHSVLGSYGPRPVWDRHEDME